MDRSGLWVVMPVKDLPDAKQRLAGVLSAQERRELFRAMLQDVLSAVAASAGLAGILVVTRDPDAQRLARHYGARVLVEDDNRGHSAASSLGARTLAREGVEGMVQLPADIPLVTPADIAALLHVHGAAPAVTLAPSRDERGSNAVACSPPDILPLRFGADSFFPICNVPGRSASRRRSCAARASRSTSTPPKTSRRFSRLPRQPGRTPT